MLQPASEKHLGLILDFPLSFCEYFEKVVQEVNKYLGQLDEVKNALPRVSLVMTYI